MNVVELELVSNDEAVVPELALVPAVLVVAAVVPVVVPVVVPAVVPTIPVVPAAVVLPRVPTLVVVALPTVPVDPEVATLVVPAEVVPVVVVPLVPVPVVPELATDDVVDVVPEPFLVIELLALMSGNSSEPVMRAAASACSSWPIAAAIERLETSVSSMNWVSSGERNCDHQSTAWSRSPPTASE